MGRKSWKKSRDLSGPFGPRIIRPNLVAAHTGVNDLYAASLLRLFIAEILQMSMLASTDLGS